MSNTQAATTAPKKDATKILAWIITVIGVIMFITGIVIYGGVSAQLRAQAITVEQVTADNPGALMGKPVAGPFTALAQIHGIQVHTQLATKDADNPNGRTFGQIPQVASSNGYTYSKDVPADPTCTGSNCQILHKAGDVMTSDDMAAWAVRGTAQQSGFLQASLLLSVLAFGVAAFIAGVGITVAIIGLALLNVGRKKAAAAAIADEASK